jgi:hypothetical protein
MRFVPEKGGENFPPAREPDEIAVRALFGLVNAGNAGRSPASFLHGPTEPIKPRPGGKELRLAPFAPGARRIPGAACVPWLRRRRNGFSPHILLAGRRFDAKLSAVGDQTNKNSPPRATGQN